MYMTLIGDARMGKRNGEWNSINSDGLFDRRMPNWVYQLRPGDELRKSDGEIVIFDRAMQKNVAFRDTQGKCWKGRPYMFVAWRSGSLENLEVLSGPAKYVTDGTAARGLKRGDVALFVLSTKRIYIARVEGTPNAKTIAARDLSGKAYRYPLDSFVMILPSGKFPE